MGRSVTPCPPCNYTPRLCPRLVLVSHRDTRLRCRPAIIYCLGDGGRVRYLRHIHLSCPWRIIGGGGVARVSSSSSYTASKPGEVRLNATTLVVVTRATLFDGSEHDGDIQHGIKVKRPPRVRRGRLFLEDGNVQGIQLRLVVAWVVGRVRLKAQPPAPVQALGQNAPDYPRLSTRTGSGSRPLLWPLAISVIIPMELPNAPHWATLHLSDKELPLGIVCFLVRRG